MQELLSRMIGRRMSILCTGAAGLRGELLKVEGGVLYLKDDEDQLSYVAVDKIVVVWEAREHESRAGFVPV
ncbi:MAG: MM0924 family protein, partial [Pyrinomonadaceae bacterium]